MMMDVAPRPRTGAASSVASAAFLLLLSRMIKPSSCAAPKLDAVFYNLWASQIDWTDAQWAEDMGYLTAIEVKWAFVTYTSCCDSHVYTEYCWSGGVATNQTQALYNTTNSDYVQVGIDVLGSFLQAAEGAGIEVLVGLQLVPMTNMSATSALYVQLVQELHAGYGHFKSFRGYYLTQEWSPASYVYDGGAEQIGREFIGPISDAVHALDPTLEVG
jgi:hypothetical protein